MIEKTHNLAFDMCQAQWLVDKVRTNEVYAQNLYAALCNNEFQEQELFELLKGQTWSCTWRSAGGIIADMREQGDYMDWYCSGIKGNKDDIDYAAALEKGYDLKNYVAEGVITEEILEDLAKLGWIPVESVD